MATEVLAQVVVQVAKEVAVAAETVVAVAVAVRRPACLRERARSCSSSSS